ncbi:MAG TPA: LysR family transcriptional regulator [Verrucomicrobiae bacterium]|jgi:DNA-binding transcriptional LysR family regulator
MNFNDVDLDLIRCFVTVVESDGFTQASKRLHTTQSAVTLKIKRLEEQLGCRLFRKTTPPLQLSVEGEVALGYAVKLMSVNREMMLRVSRPQRDDTLRVGLLDPLGRQVLPLWMVRFAQKFPGQKIVTEVGFLFDLLKQLEEDKLDAVIGTSGYTSMSEYKFAPALEETRLHHHELHWVKAEGSKIDVSKDPLPLVMFGANCGLRLRALEALQQHNRTFDIVFVGGTLNLVQAAVVGDLGITALSPFAFADGMVVVQDLSLPLLPASNIAAYYRKKSDNTKVQELVSFLFKAFADMKKETSLMAKSVLGKARTNGEQKLKPARVAG